MLSKKVFGYEVTEIYDNTYLINEHLSTMFLLCGDKRALVIDCGTGVGDFMSVIEGLTSLPYDVVMTHSHVDHIGGRGQFGDIYVSAPDSKFIKGVNLLQRKGFVKIFSLQNNKFSGLKVKPVSKEPVVHIVKDGDVFDLGSRTIKAYFTPGHTIGSMSYLDEENRTIFIGDIANENLLMFLPHSTTISEMLVTLDSLLLNDNYDTIWASHHTQSLTRDDVKKYIKGAREVLRQKKNTVLPVIKTHDEDGALLVYRTSHVHN